MVNLGENKAVLMGIGGAILLTAGALFLTFRTYQKAEEEKTEIESLRRAIADAREKKRRIPQLEREVIILRSNVEEYVKILPEEKHIHGFINTINRFQKETGITMTKFDSTARRGNRKKKKHAFDRIVYKLKISGSFKTILKFINKFENYERFVAIGDFVFRPARKRLKGEMNEVPLDGSLTLETYQYNATGSGRKLVKIARFEELREALQEQIIAQRNAIEVHRYRLDPIVVEARRDIFKDPRRRLRAAEDRPPGVERLQKQKRFLAWARNELKEIQGMILAEENEPLIIRQMEIRKQIDDRVSNLQSQLVSARTERLITVAALVEELGRDVISPLARIIKERSIAVRTGLSSDDLKIILSKMTHFFKKGDLDQVIVQFDLFAKQIGSSDTQDPEIKALVVEIYDLKNRALVIREFSKRPIKISGIIALKGSPVAIINGRVYERGQMLDEDVRIQAIHPEEIEFVFRDVRIIRRWE